MTRAPHVCVFGKFVPLRATELRHASNDALRVVALVVPTNDNCWMGGRPA